MVASLVNRKIILNGKWQFQEKGKREWLPAKVPGCVHTDLLASKSIPDPFYGTNELDLQWIDQKDWLYKRNFKVKSAFLAGKVQELVCEGIDTITIIYINGKHIGCTENMFRRYTFDVTNLLQKGKNTIEIHFFSPSRYGEKKSKKISYDVPNSEYHWPLGQRRVTYRNQIRKAQYQFGWDWAPCLVTSGIWRDIFLISTSGPRFEYITTEQHISKKRAQLTVIAYLISPCLAKGTIKAILKGPYNCKCKKNQQEVGQERKIYLRAGKNKVYLKLKIENPCLWFPNGYGEQALYGLDLVFYTSDGEISDAKSIKIGFRNVKLIRRADKAGESFYFKVNGIPVFVKGANWVPADSFPSCITPERYVFLLQSAVDANMNMLRVWGGGIFEHDIFYNLCDQKGIMLWHDFLFACCAYPATKEFLKNVTAEVQHQIRRLKHHTSIVLWCGNNENEDVCGNNEDVATLWGKNKKHIKQLAQDYCTLQKTLTRIHRLEDPQRPFWPASPFPPEDLSRGDEHFYKVNNDRKPISDYLKVKPRFCSEFGFQAFPSIHTLRSVIDRGDENLSSPVMEHHQRKHGWNGILLDYLCSQFRFPSTVEDICYLTQIQQALAMKCAVEHWRRCKPHTMGTLYWQLEDCWPAISWAGIDYKLRWKALHYFARQFYSPLLISFVEKSNHIQIWLTSDLNTSVEGTWVFTIWTTRGKKLAVIENSFYLKSLANKLIARIPLKKIFVYNYKKEEIILHACIQHCKYSSSNIHVFVPYKCLELEQPDLRVSVRGSDKNKLLRIEIRSNTIALFAELDPGKTQGVFSDNFFHVFPGERTQVIFKSTGNHRPQILKKITVRTLRDTYH